MSVAPAPPKAVFERLADQLQRLNVRYSESIETVFASTEALKAAAAATPDITVEDASSLLIVSGTKQALYRLLTATSRASGTIYVDCVSGTSIAMALAGPDKDAITHFVLQNRPSSTVGLSVAHQALVRQYTLRNSKYAAAMYLMPSDKEIFQGARSVSSSWSYAFVQSTAHPLDVCIAITPEGFKRFSMEAFLRYYVDGVREEYRRLNKDQDPSMAFLRARGYFNMLLYKIEFALDGAKDSERSIADALSDVVFWGPM